MRKKWIYAKMPGYVTRATDMLTGENEEILARGDKEFSPLTEELRNLDFYGTVNRVVSEEEALKYAVEELGATREAFYKDDE